MTTVNTAVSYDALPEAFGPLLGLAEHWDKLVEEAWIDEKFSASEFMTSVPEVPFPNNKGTSQQYGVWRPGKKSVLGIADWTNIETSRAPGTNGAGDPGLSACKNYNPKLLTFGGNEIFRNSGKQLLLASPAICVQDLRFQDEAQMQIALRIDHLIKQVFQYRTVWSESQFIKSVMYADHGYIMGNGFNPTIGSSDTPKWYTDVEVQDANGKYHLYYPAGTKVGTINWEVLIRQQRYLAAQAAQSASANVGGMAVFMAYGDSQDLFDALLANPATREDARYAMPEVLIGDFRKFSTFRGIAIGHNPGQWRYKPVGIVDGTSISNGRGGTLGATNWVKCERVDPEREGRTILDGAAVVEANPEYFDAPLRLLPIMMNRIMIKQVGTPFTNLDSRMSFGPTPGMNGELMFLAIQDAKENPFREIGNFFCRFEYWVKPDRYYLDTVCYLYAACNREEISLCENSGIKTSAVALAAVAAAADVDDDNYTITVTLKEALKAATGGTTVTVTDSGATASTGYVLDASQAPTYVIGYTSTAWASAFTGSVTAAADVAAVLTTAATVAVA